jgi:Sigma-54 interaction domain
MWYQRISQTRHPNLLIVGDERATQAATLRLIPWLPTPVRAFTLPGRLVLPDPDQGTLVLHNVSALDREQQHQLMRWLEKRTGASPIVSTAPLSVFAGVEGGTFSEGLYYRLNIILETVGE